MAGWGGMDFLTVDFNVQVTLASTLQRSWFEYDGGKTCKKAHAENNLIYETDKFQNLCRAYQTFGREWRTNPVKNMLEDVCLYHKSIILPHQFFIG